MSDEPSEFSTPLPWGDGPYSIKRHGTTLTTCESEPTRTPGCIQAHGVLLALRPSDLTILQASENTARFFTDPPEALLGQSISRVIGQDNTVQLHELLSSEPVERSVKHAFSMLAIDGTTALDVSMHTNGGVLILEFEATHRNAEQDGRDYFEIVKAAICHIQAANSLRNFCQRVTEELAKITGIDRTMVYRFHADFHGEVFAESKRADLHSLLGLHYPAEDIPKQARDIYKRIWIRPLPDAAGALVEMIPLANPDTGQPLDMTYCALRGASVMYTEYLANMGVRASLTMPIDSALRLRMLVMELVVSRSERLTELNADLTRSNDELDAFAYVASHDLKEPLRGIHKYAHQLLESAQLLDQESRRRVENLMRLTVRMDSLLDSLLHFSRVGRTTLELESVDLNEVVDESLEMVGARRSDCTLRVDVPRLLPTWRCDRVRVREIFTNLVSNAMKYMRGTFPHSEIGYLMPGETGERPNAPALSLGHTVFFLKDFGIGIEARHYEQIFRMFKRLHGRDEFGGGVGAGLTIVQKLVQRHGGCVWLDSVVGVGTTFYFTIPCGDGVVT